MTRLPPTPHRRVAALVLAALIFGTACEVTSICVAAGASGLQIEVRHRRGLPTSPDACPLAPADTTANDSAVTVTDTIQSAVTAVDSSRTVAGLADPR